MHDDVTHTHSYISCSSHSR